MPSKTHVMSFQCLPPSRTHVISAFKSPSTTRTRVARAIPLLLRTPILFVCAPTRMRARAHTHTHCKRRECAGGDCDCDARHRGFSHRCPYIRTHARTLYDICKHVCVRARACVCVKDANRKHAAGCNRCMCSHEFSARVSLFVGGCLGSRSCTRPLV